jgi:Kae1-associated kinase Bud32
MTRETQGAEAVISVEDGTVIKDRIPKQYRHPDLDNRLRTDRTDLEARLLRKAARAGVRVPTVETVKDTTLKMEQIDGSVLREVLEDEIGRYTTIGEYIARLHNSDIIHGDLTTSNMIRADDDMYFIDFGLGYFSQRTEDRAVDLHLLRDVLDSTHTAVADKAMTRIRKAYREHADDADAVLDRYEEIKERGRYT